jgi:hypothetical protein
MTFIPLQCGVVKTPRVEIEVLTTGVVSEVDNKSKKQVIILPSKFSGMYRVDVPEMN